jgi:hypothetical protein
MYEAPFFLPQYGDFAPMGVFFQGKVIVALFSAGSSRVALKQLADNRLNRLPRLAHQNFITGK